MAKPVIQPPIACPAPFVPFPRCTIIPFVCVVKMPSNWVVAVVMVMVMVRIIINYLRKNKPKIRYGSVSVPARPLGNRVGCTMRFVPAAFALGVFAPRKPCLTRRFAKIMDNVKAELADFYNTIYETNPGVVRRVISSRWRPRDYRSKCRIVPKRPWGPIAATWTKCVPVVGAVMAFVGTKVPGGNPPQQSPMKQKQLPIKALFGKLGNDAKESLPGEESVSLTKVSKKLTPKLGLLHSISFDKAQKASYSLESGVAIYLLQGTTIYRASESSTKTVFGHVPFTSLRH